MAHTSEEDLSGHPWRTDCLGHAEPGELWARLLRLRVRDPTASPRQHQNGGLERSVPSPKPLTWGHQLLSSTLHGR